MKKVVYTSDKKTHFFQELGEIYKDIKSSNFLAFQMAKRDLQGQYRQSFLGFFWAFAPVITNSLVWIFLNASGTVNVNGASNIPYILFVVIGTTLWSIFTESLLIPINSVNGAKGILSKINFPKEALLISGIYKMVFNLALKMCLIALFLIIYGVTPNIQMIYFPLILITVMIFSITIGLFFTPIGLIYNDISKIITTTVPFLMYFTPVVYAVPKMGLFRRLFELNPLTYLFNDARSSLLGLPVQHMPHIIILLVICLVAMLLALVIFRKSMPIIIEKIS